MSTRDREDQVASGFWLPSGRPLNTSRIPQLPEFLVDVWWQE